MSENPIPEEAKSDHLVLLIGTNPLPNFVVADYFLQNNPKLQKIWLLHSEKNNLQAGTDKQAKNLETLLTKRWQGKHKSLRFPLEKISLTDVSHAATILREIENKMLKAWRADQSFHLNYTGGTKAMATHVYRRLQELQKRGENPFSYLDANNFRLVVDDYGVLVDDLRKHVQIEFAELIALHGFTRKNKDSHVDPEEALKAYQKIISDPLNNPMNEQDGKPFEGYLAKQLSNKIGKSLNNVNPVLQNWEIKQSNWITHFELDVVLLHGYHLTGISCTVSYKKESCKSKGFEVVLRTRQIGGEEARSILITRSNKNQTSLLQEELVYETGGQGNILVLGIDDLRKEELYLRKIEKFVF